MPIPGGTSIVAKPSVVNVAGFNKGTLGAWVKYYLSQEPAFLTNGHVLPQVAVDVYCPDVNGEILGAVLDTGYNDRIDAAIGKCSLTAGLLHAAEDVPATSGRSRVDGRPRGARSASTGVGRARFAESFLGSLE